MTATLLKDHAHGILVRDDEAFKGAAQAALARIAWLEECVRVKDNWIEHQCDVIHTQNGGAGAHWCNTCDDKDKCPTITHPFDGHAPQTPQTTLQEAVARVTAKLMALSQEDFNALLEEHTDGPWADLLREVQGDGIR